MAAYLYSKRARLEPTRMADSVKPKTLKAAKSTEPKKARAKVTSAAKAGATVSKNG